VISGLDVSNIALVNSEMTFVMGASNGRLVSFAKLDRR
jgi:hypothetical protein